MLLPPPAANAAASGCICRGGCLAVSFELVRDAVLDPFTCKEPAGPSPKADDACLEVHAGAPGDATGMLFCRPVGGLFGAFLLSSSSGTIVVTTSPLAFLTTLFLMTLRTIFFVCDWD